MLPGDKTRAKDFVHELSGGAGSMLGFMLAGFVGGAVGLPAEATTMMVGGLTGATQQFEDAESFNAVGLQKYMSFMLGGAIGLTEAIPINRMLFRADAATGGLVRRMLTNTAAGGIEAAASDDVDFVYESTIGWPSSPAPYLEIYEAPLSWAPVPSTGWIETDGGGWKYYGSTPPPTIAAPDAAHFGKVAAQLVVGGGLKDVVLSADMTSGATVLVRSASVGLESVAHRETTEFDEVRAWIGSIQRDLRLLETALAAGGGVPTSRTITAGAGLTGGGSLAADRTLDVAAGRRQGPAEVRPRAEGQGRGPRRTGDRIVRDGGLGESETRPRQLAREAELVEPGGTVVGDARRQHPLLPSPRRALVPAELLQHREHAPAAHALGAGRHVLPAQQEAEELLGGGGLDLAPQTLRGVAVDARQEAALAELLGARGARRIEAAALF